MAVLLAAVLPGSAVQEHAALAMAQLLQAAPGLAGVGGPAPDLAAADAQPVGASPPPTTTVFFTSDDAAGEERKEEEADMWGS